MIFNNLTKRGKNKICALDTETYTLIDGVIVSEEKLLEIGREQEISYFRQHATAKVYAWIIAVDERFAIAETFDEFIQTLIDYNITCGWWYNAKYDFANIDYAILSNSKWKPLTKENKDEIGYFYQSLSNDMGARYSYELHVPCVNTHKKQVCREIKMFDFCNIFGGGLANILIDFNIQDSKGNPVRKLEMDYQQNKDENGKFLQSAINYMGVDGVGLYKALMKANEFLKQHFNYQIADKSKPDFMTAGGFAKKLLLRYLYNKENNNENLKAFKKEYWNCLALDKQYRFGGLYRGGICIVNERFQNIMINKPFKRYDINSMYPAQMDKMKVLKGKPHYISYDYYKKTRDDEKNTYIIEIEEMEANLKQGFLPVWYDINLKSYVKHISFNSLDRTYMIYANEFDELSQWYDIDYIKIKSVYYYVNSIDSGYNKFIADLYSLKNQGKKENNKVMTAFAKLGLNSSYGKLSERPDKVLVKREISEDTGAVHLVRDGVEMDEKTMLAVWQGALITSMAHTFLLKSIRENCPIPERDFIYCDTDSIHIFTEYKNADDYKLGEFKLEASCVCGKWLAPKTYYEIEEDGTIEIHSKGISTKYVANVMAQEGAIQIIYNKEKNKTTYKALDINKIDSIFAVGREFQCLCALNVKGGKILAPIMKVLCKPENTTIRSNLGNDEMFYNELIK